MWWYDYPTIHLFDALLYLLSRECARYETFVVAFVADGGAGCDYGGYIYGTIAIGRNRSAGRNDMCACSYGYGCGRYCGNAGCEDSYYGYLICNFAIAFIAPPILSAWGNGTCTVVEILMRVAPLLISPFVVAQLCRWLTPKAARWIGSHTMIPVYIWLWSLVVIIGKTTYFIIQSGTSHLATEIVLAVVALVICLVQFGVGRWLGKRYGDVAAGTQALGQKNTVMAVWLAQSFLNPLSCVAPTAYIVWQNIVNSYQIYKHR